MSASENQAAETSKDGDDSKVEHPWNIVHIRLPPRKKLSDASLILSKKVPGNTSNTGSKEVSEPVADNPGNYLITASVQSEACSHSPRARLCNEADSNTMSKSLSAESESDTDTAGNKLLDGANVSSPSKILRVAAEEQGSDASSYVSKDGLCEEANNSNPSMILPLPVQELPEDTIDSSPSKNHATTGNQGEEEKRDNSPRKKLPYNDDSKLADEEGNSPNWNITITAVKHGEVFEGANHPIPTKLSDEVNNAPSIRPTDLAIESTTHKSLLTSSVQATGTSQNTPGMNLSASIGQAVEGSTNAANMEVTKVHQEFEEKIQRNVYLENLSHQATEAKTNPSRTLSTTAIECAVFEHANHPIPTKKLSGVARNNSPSNGPTETAKKSTPSKNLRVAAEEQGSDASSSAGLSEETNNNIPSMIIPVPVQKLAEDHMNNSRSKNIPTTGKQGKDKQLKSSGNKLIYDTDIKVEDEEGNYPSWNPTVTAVKYEKVFEEANRPISSEKLSDEARNNGSGPTNSANNRPVYKRRRTSSVQGTGTSQSPPGMKLSAFVGHAVEKGTIAANMDVTKVSQELEKNIKRSVYLDNLSHQATEAKTNPSRTLSVTAIKCEVSELANPSIPTKKLSHVGRNKAPSNRPTHPGKESTPRKKPRISPVQATGTSQSKSAMKVFTSDGQAINQSKSDADLEAIKKYQEFEEKVKRTVYLDNLSDQATEAVIKAALSQFCTIRKVSFVVNYTIPYNIPRSALVEMETEKDAEVVVSMLHDFPFMMSGMPRPARAIHATAEMFPDRRRRPGSKLNFRFVGHTDPDYGTLKKLKLLSRRHEVENFALIENELEEEKTLAAKQQENLNCNYKMMAAMDSVLLSGMSRYVSDIYNVGWNDMF